MDIAVTGSSGLIGRALVRSLEADGHRVARVVRGDATGSDTIAWSPDDGRIDAAALEGIDAVVHLAGEGIANRRWSDAQKRRILESRTKGTALVAETLAGLQRAPRTLLSASAIGWYGDRGTDVLTEDSAPGRGFLTDVCTAWEGATRAAEDAGVRVAHLRTGIVLDRAGGALAKMLPLFRFGLGGRMGSGRQMWSWITLHDEVAAIRFLLDHDARGPHNLTAPEPVDNRTFTKALARAVRRPALFPVPSFGPALLLGGELAHNLLFTSADVRPARLTAAGFAFAHPTLEVALAAVLDDAPATATVR